LVWFKQASFYNTPINHSILLQKASDFGEKFEEDFKATNGWLTRWKDRHGIVYKKLHREKQDSDGLAADNWLQTDWKLENIFKTDETGLYYRATPDYSMIFKKASASAGKKVTDKITVLLTYNMTGTIKMKPLVTGKHKSP
jgi:hypothetical protein